MTDISHAAGPMRGRDRRAEQWEFKALVAATYPLFLAAAVLRRATGGARRGARSVFAEAHATAAATLAFAFMG